MQNILVIVDMQKGYYLYPFKEKFSEVKKNIIKQINKFKKNNDWIIILELDPDEIGTTNSTIMRAVYAYDKVKVLTKFSCDGSTQIISFLDSIGLCKDYFTPNFHICGLYGDQCVLQTFLGLIDHFHDTAYYTVLKRTLMFWIQEYNEYDGQSIKKSRSRRY